MKKCIRSEENRALITGAARGIGYLTAGFMAEQGCNLILHSRSLEHTEKILAEVRARDVSAHAVAADLNDPAAVERMLEEIDSLGVQVDIVLTTRACRSPTGTITSLRLRKIMKSVSGSIPSRRP
jgi:Short-chain dehydrogenases of various substrate specificities